VCPEKTGVPESVGEAIVGDVPNTSAPLPVSPVTAEARFAELGVPKKVATFAPRPATPVEIGRPVASARSKAGVASEPPRETETPPYETEEFARAAFATVPAVSAPPSMVPLEEMVSALEMYASSMVEVAMTEPLASVERRVEVSEEIAKFVVVAEVVVAPPSTVSPPTIVEDACDTNPEFPVRRPENVAASKREEPTTSKMFPVVEVALLPITTTSEVSAGYTTNESVVVAHSPDPPPPPVLSAPQLGTPPETLRTCPAEPIPSLESVLAPEAYKMSPSVNEV